MLKIVLNLYIPEDTEGAIQLYVTVPSTLISAWEGWFEHYSFQNAQLQSSSKDENIYYALRLSQPERWNKVAEIINSLLVEIRQQREKAVLDFILNIPNEDCNVTFPIDLFRGNAV